jgi:hypothetical protein
MTIATARPQDVLSPSDTAAVPDEVALAGLTELLVLRDHDDRWWEALARRTDVLALAMAAHDIDPAGRCIAPASGSAVGMANDARDRRLQAEHAEIARELADLRVARVGAGRPRASLVLAETIEIAWVRGHNQWHVTRWRRF